EENEQDLLKLTRWLRKIQRRDFFPSSASREAVAHLPGCRQALVTFTSTVYEQEGLPQPSPEDASQSGSAQEEEATWQHWSLHLSCLSSGRVCCHLLQLNPPRFPCGVATVVRASFV